MVAQLIDGKAIADSVHRNLSLKVEEYKRTHHRTPALAVVLVGNDTASEIYVSKKQQACEKVGMVSILKKLPSTTSQAELENIILSLNEDPEISGILVQLPLPEHLDEAEILEKISPFKDVDGFHPYNVGRLTQRQPVLRPCTPFGVMTLLKTLDLELHGLEALVIGASNIVGRPMALELLLAGATVTICHRFSNDLQGHVEKADLVVAAAGKPHLVKGEWIKPGAIVIDVGIHRGADGNIIGDVEFHTAKEKAGWITPVPGGVGPMTVAMLLENTLQAANILTATEINKPTQE